MEIKISLFAVLLILFFINTVSDHLSNCLIRESEPSKRVIVYGFYIVKTVALILILNSIT